MKHHLLVFVHSYTNFELNNSKFAQMTQFRENFQKIQNPKKLERLKLFWSNLIPKVLERFIIFVCIFRMIAQILRKLELPQIFFEEFEIP